MADEPVKVNVQSRRVDSSILPNTFSQPYRLYIIQQNTDMLSIANAANNAGELAYEATVKNDQQDVILADHESRISGLRVEVDDHEIRITTNSSNIAAIDIRVTSVEGSITTINANIADLQSNKASKTEALLKADNLSGLANVITSRANLGLGDSATKNTGTTAGTVAAGDDSRFNTVNGNSGGTITSAVTVNGSMSSTGYSCRTGVTGTTIGNKFNINWTGTAAELWIDTTKIGTINITP
ncbi:phage tail protein [Enterobacter ludwigii]|uniref:phage tail protein n=1 Tax=Enterobacter ludwigii TaxID=299767 RepID=UPI001EF90A08|nr:phage tail protein [Enterobacter ludwigii]